MNSFNYMNRFVYFFKTALLIALLLGLPLYAQAEEVSENSEGAGGITAATETSAEVQPGAHTSTSDNGSEKKQPQEDTGYLLSGSEISGGGGGAMFLYGYNDKLKDMMSFGGRGFATLGRTVRLGGLGMGFSQTAEMQTGGGFGGFFAEYLFRFDPLIIGLGLTTGGAGFAVDTGERDQNGNVITQNYGYFVLVPNLEFELRVAKSVSFSLYNYYGAFFGKSSNPEINHAAGGFAFTFGVF